MPYLIVVNDYKANNIGFETIKELNIYIKKKLQADKNLYLKSKWKNEQNRYMANFQRIS